VREYLTLAQSYDDAWGDHIASGSPLRDAEGIIEMSNRVDAARDALAALAAAGGAR